MTGVLEIQPAPSPQLFLPLKKYHANTPGSLGQRAGKMVLNIAY